MGLPVIDRGGAGGGGIGLPDAPFGAVAGSALAVGAGRMAGSDERGVRGGGELGAFSAGVDTGAGANRGPEEPLEVTTRLGLAGVARAGAGGVAGASAAGDSATGAAAGASTVGGAAGVAGAGFGGAFSAAG